MGGYYDILRTKEENKEHAETLNILKEYNRRHFLITSNIPEENILEFLLEGLENEEAAEEETENNTDELQLIESLDLIKSLDTTLTKLDEDYDENSSSLEKLDEDYDENSSSLEKPDTIYITLQAIISNIINFFNSIKQAIFSKTLFIDSTHSSHKNYNYLPEKPKIQIAGNPDNSENLTPEESKESKELEEYLGIKNTYSNPRLGG